MKRPVDFLLLLAASLVIPICGAEPQMIVYPAKNQSAEQQSKDQGECNAWAKQSTGIDPAAVAPTPPPAPAAQQPPAGPSGERLKGAVPLPGRS